jgi:transitional endoplasmic reticulum ATPase
MPLAEDVNLDTLSEHTETYTGAEIASVCSAASILAINDFLKLYPDPVQAKNKKSDLKVYYRHFEAAFEKLKPLTLQSVIVGKGTQPALQSPMRVT